MKKNITIKEIIEEFDRNCFNDDGWNMRMYSETKGWLVKTLTSLTQHHEAEVERARNEAIKECEGCKKAAPDSWDDDGPYWFVQDGERISEKYFDELEMYKDLWRFMYGVQTIKPLLPRANITSDQ